MNNAATGKRTTVPAWLWVVLAMSSLKFLFDLGRVLTGWQPYPTGRWNPAVELFISAGGFVLMSCYVGRRLKAAAVQGPPKAKSRNT
jgi:hypothetical protein